LSASVSVTTLSGLRLSIQQ